MIREGERLRNGFNGRVYVVKAVRNNLVVLDGEGDPSWIITDKGILRTFYTKIGPKVGEMGSSLSSTMPSVPSKGTL